MHFQLGDRVSTIRGTGTVRSIPHGSVHGPFKVELDDPQFHDLSSSFYSGEMTSTDVLAPPASLKKLARRKRLQGYLKAGISLNQMQSRFVYGTVSAADWATYRRLWIWGSHREDYRQHRYYLKFGMASTTARMNRVKAVIDRLIAAEF